MHNNFTLTCADSTKYLGVILDNQLYFKLHVALVQTKLCKAIGIMSKLRHLFPSSTLLQLYYALFHPHILYELPLWGNTFSSYLQKIQRLQNKAIRIITNSNNRATVVPYLREHGILKISDLYQFEIAKIMHQFSTQSLPSCFADLFDRISNIHDRRTRSTVKNNLYLPKFSTNHCQKSIQYWCGKDAETDKAGTGIMIS